MNQDLPSTPVERRERLLNRLIETGSFRMSETPTFPLASGALSPYYVDCKIVLSYPDVRQLVGELMLESVTAAGAFAIGGLIIGAYPIAIAVSDVAYRETGREIRAFVIRKEPKRHGLKKCVEGIERPSERGERVVIVDDVITSGKSTIDAIRTARREGFEVVKALALVDREEQDGRRAVEGEGVDFEALCTLTELKHRYPEVAAKR